MTNLSDRIVTCPQCRQPAQWSAKNPFKPFCSERCKLIDLGAWFNEEHRIAGSADYADVSTDDTNDDHK